jgi:hypothetical protein
MNRTLVLVGSACTAVAALALSACGSSTSASTTTAAPASTTSAPSTTAPPPTTTSSSVATAPPFTAAALQAALPSGTTVVTGDLGFKCEGGYAGSEITIVTTSSGGPAGGIGSDTLFRAENGAWVEIGRSAATCAEVPASIHVYCTVS